MPFQGSDIHITSNYLPESWWGEKTKFNRQAIDRRISVVHWHYRYKGYLEYKTKFEEDGSVLDGNYAMDQLRARLLKPHPSMTINGKFVN